MKRSKGVIRPQQHCIVAITLPPKAVERRLLPFTQQVIDMPADAGKALVFDRRDEGIQRISALCGAAMKAAMRRDPKKMFQTRTVQHRGVETCAVWRLK